MSIELPLHLIEADAQTKEAALALTGAAFFATLALVGIPLVLATVSVSGTADRLFHYYYTKYVGLGQTMWDTDNVCMATEHWRRSGLRV
jgi:hypothetical protein